MGWKASFIIATATPEKVLLPASPHQPEIAQAFLGRLPLPPHERVGEATFQKAVYPRDQELYLGAYDKTVLLCHNQLVDECLDEGTPEVIRVLRDFLGDMQALAVTLHSVVNLYGYALFRGVDQVRVRAGSWESGVMIDHGEWLPEEKPLYEKSTLRDGERIFLWEYDGKTEELDHSTAGEEFVFEVCKRFFGTRLDFFEMEQLKLEEYRPIKRGFWERWFGKGQR